MHININRYETANHNMEDHLKNRKYLSQIFYGGCQILRIEYPEFMEEIGKLRVEAWKDIEGMNQDLMAKGCWIDDTDADAIHWVIFSGKKLVGSARMTVHEKVGDLPYGDLIKKYPLDELVPPVSSINRLVIHSDYMNKGLARKMDEIRINTAKEMGVKYIIAQPVSWRIDALKKQGFKYIGPIGQPFEAPGLTLTLMIKKIDPTT